MWRRTSHVQHIAAVFSTKRRKPVATLPEPRSPCRHAPISTTLTSKRADCARQPSCHTSTPPTGRVRDPRALINTTNKDIP